MPPLKRGIIKMKDNIQEIIWFTVADALPCPEREVLVSDGNTVTTSKVESIEVLCDGERWKPNWRDGIIVVKWAFMPQAPMPESEKLQSTEISVW